MRLSGAGCACPEAAGSNAGDLSRIDAGAEACRREGKDLRDVFVLKLRVVGSWAGPRRTGREGVEEPLDGEPPPLSQGLRSRRRRRR